MRRLVIFLALALVVIWALPAMAAFNGQIPVNGPHWQVNFIGVTNPKNVDMTDSKRRTIFVPLDKQGNHTTCRINYTWDINNNTFEVIDGNATDGAATIRVPYQPVSLTESGSNYLSYRVFAVSLGKPGGEAIITAHCTYSEDVIDTKNNLDTCEDSLLMNSFTLPRNTGKPKVIEITDIFRASGCFDMNQNDVCDAGDYQFSDMWIFNLPFLEEYYWTYDNYGLKHMQVRFYQTTSGTWTVK